MTDSAIIDSIIMIYRHKNPRIISADNAKCTKFLICTKIISR